MAKSFSKFYRGHAARELMRKHPKAFLLLALIHNTADYRNGKAFVGDAKAIGRDTTEQQYRTAKNVLKKMKLVKFCGIPGQGTEATIISDKIFSMKNNGEDNGMNNVTKNGTNNGTDNGEFEAKNGQNNGMNNVSKNGAGNGASNGMNNDYIEDNIENTIPPIIPHGDDLFLEFWKYYPKRNGKKLGKARTEKLFNKLSADDQTEIIGAVKNYAASGQMAKDPERFIKGDYWRDWITAGNNNGNGKAQGNEPMKNILEVEEF